jgi:hypothetical protein
MERQDMRQCGCLKKARRMALAVVALLLGAAPLSARTITLTAEDADQMAVISAQAPRLSWAAVRHGPGAFHAGPQLQMFQRSAVLIRIPLEQIPPGQRIIKAELTLKAEHVDGPVRLDLRRLTADWGHGVCHLYRRAYPRKEEWAQPGGRGPGDRADRAAPLHFKAVGEQTVDVTEDIDLWYTGAAANRGWILSFESGYSVYFRSPYWPATDGAKEWKLRITFEPR